MFRRVALIALGGVLYVILRNYGVPMRLSAILALVPFGILEAKNLAGPYEKSAHELMHEQDTATVKPPSDRTPGAA